MTLCCMILFFFNDTATTEIYTLSLHDALPISRALCRHQPPWGAGCGHGVWSALGVFIDRPDPRSIVWHLRRSAPPMTCGRSEEHTSELQSLAYLVCRLLLEKKKKK